MTNFKNANKGILALVAVAVILAGILAPALSFKNAYAADDTWITIADQTGAQTGQQLNSGGKTLMVEYTDDDSRLTLQEVDTLSVSLRKGGSPTGTAYICMFDTSRNCVYQFGTKDVSTLTTSYVVYQFENTAGSGYLIPHGANNLFGVKYESGDATNYVDVRRSKISTGGDDFESTTSYKQYYTTSWHSNTDEDLLFKLENHYDSAAVSNNGDDGAACDQIWDISKSDDIFLLNPSANWQNNGIQRCISASGEDTGGLQVVGATLTTNDLQIYSTSYYGIGNGGSQVPMKGHKITVDESGTSITTGFTATGGEFNPVVADLSAGSHTIRVGAIFDDAVDCASVSGGSMTCTEWAEGQETGVDLTFTVS